MGYKRFLMVLLSLSAIFCFVSVNSGCGNKEGDEPTKYRSQAGLEKLQKRQEQMLKKVAKQQAGDNRAFNSSKDIQGNAAEVRDLDAVIRPVLKRLFGDAKIIDESKSAQTQRDGEVVENRFTYVVNKGLVRQDGKALHTALHAVGFGLSPRLGSEPTTWSGGAIMSLFRRTSLRSYSLVIKVDTVKQRIVVESYRLGSKYDRLM
jgi:hypothetical protein